MKSEEGWHEVEIQLLGKKKIINGEEFAVFDKLRWREVKQK